MELLQSIPSIKDKDELLCAIEAVDSNLDFYLNNVNTSGPHLNGLLSRVVQEEMDTTEQSLQLYCKLLIKLHARKERTVILSTEFNTQKSSLSFAVLNCLSELMGVEARESTSTAENIASLVSSTEVSVENLLHAIVTSSSSLDECINIQQREYGASLSPLHNKKRYKILETIQSTRPDTFSRYMRALYITILTAGMERGLGESSRGPLVFPQLLREYHVYLSNANKINSDLNWQNSITKVWCEVLYSNRQADKGDWVQRLLFLLDQQVPAHQVVGAIVTHLISTHPKAKVRTVAVTHLLKLLPDVCHQYTIVDEYIREMASQDTSIQFTSTKQLSSSRNLNSKNEVLSMGLDADTILSIVPPADYAELLRTAYRTLWASALDAVMLDPAERVRWSVLSQLVVVLQGIKITALTQVHWASIEKRYLKVLIMKVSDCSERIRKKAIETLLVTLKYSGDNLIHLEESYLLCRNVLRVSTPLFQDKDYQRVMELLVSNTLFPKALEEVTARNTITTYLEDLQHAVELICSRLKLQLLSTSKINGIDIDRVALVIVILKRCVYNALNPHLGGRP